MEIAQLFSFHHHLYYGGIIEGELFAAMRSSLKVVGSLKVHTINVEVLKL